METNPLNNLAHSSPNPDPAKQRKDFEANVEKPCAAWEMQKTVLNNLDERTKMENTFLSGHEVKHINAKNPIARGTSKAAEKLGILNTKISSEEPKHKKR